MAAEVHIDLLLFLIGFMEIVTAQWNIPPFTAPNLLPGVVDFVGYVENSGQTNIILHEEVDYNVTIAVINYIGSSTPVIGTFEDNRSNLILGAVFVLNNETGFWEVVITKKQDYETEIMRTYRFFVVIDSQQYKIALNIKNIDDNAPVIQAHERICAVEENYEGPMNCTFTVSDADGWIDQVTFDITSTPPGGSDHFNVVTKSIVGTQYQMDAYLEVIKSLDYETIAMYMLLLKAIDGGGNEGNITTVVEVIDMPDEPPKWTSLISVENILEKSTNIFSVSAIDGDYGINAEINYKIVTTEERDEEFFQVNKTSGVITINPIDRDALSQEIFTFMIIAYEAEDEESSINATVLIIVEDINDHTPEVTPTEVSIAIEEETYMTLVFDESIVISDPDLAENAQFNVVLTDDSDVNWSSAFLIIPTSGYQSGNFTISVVNASLLDYEDEDWRDITIRIVATEVANTSHIGTRDVHIELINWNDELPIFEKDTVEVDVPEDVEAGYLIATMLATDRDVDDKVTHSLVAQRMLTIDPEIAEITTSQDGAFDYETQPIVVVQVVATDLADHRSYATLTINVADVNDVPPTLYLPSITPTIEEEVEVGTEVNTTIYATDPDTEAQLIFSIDWDSSYASKSSVPINESYYRECLQIETTYPEGTTLYAEAALKVSDRIDYEAFDTLYLTIVVTDNTTVHNANFSSSTLMLFIEDINDNAPIFNQHEEMRVTENTVSEWLIGTVTATDADGPGNNNVVYYIEPINDTKSDLVYINLKTGIIKVDMNNGIDAEEYEYLYYTVIASDGVWNTTLPIEIYVIDQNDEIPYLLPELYNSTIYLKEKSVTGTDVTNIYAQDNDRTSPFNNVSYLINTDYSSLLQYFSMRRFSGLLQVNLADGYQLDRDFGDDRYTVFLVLRDNYLTDTTWNSNMITSNVTVILEDINDQIPALPELPDPAITVTEEVKNGTLILTVVASDYDEPDTDNTRVFYEILSVTPSNDTDIEHVDDYSVLFRVETYNKTDGRIYANSDLYGYFGTWTIELYVQDLGTDPGPQNDTNLYNIRVTDYNYNDPIITFPVNGKTLRLSRIQSLHSQLYTYESDPLSDFTATDEDHGDSGVVKFSISGDEDTIPYFTVVQTEMNSAQLQLIKMPNFTAQYAYEIIVTATDGGIPPRSTSQSQRILFISTLGPEFRDNTWFVWFKENIEGREDSAIIPGAYDMANEEADEADLVDIYYFITGQENDMEYFNLDRNTRNLTLAKDLDREEQEIMRLSIVASTNSEGPPDEPRDEATLDVTVIVVDVNDNPPIFEQSLYYGGITPEDAIGRVILTVVANDADLNDTLMYKIDDDSMQYSDPLLEKVVEPFSIESSTGELLLQFKPSDSMVGYFTFDVTVKDEVNHEDKTSVKIYIISASNRVIFTFRNNISHVMDQREFIISTFTHTFGYICNVDFIKKGLDDNGVKLDNVTGVTTHFINQETNLPITSDIIILASSDLPTITDLKIKLLARYLYLIDVPTDNSTNVGDVQEIIQWVLVFLTTFFFTCCIALLVAYVVKTRRLTARLDKLAVTKFGSMDSGLNRMGIVPTTNKFASEGSNPMWKAKVDLTEDNISRRSDDSDLVGVENNPDFLYTNGGYEPDEKWDRRKKVIFGPGAESSTDEVKTEMQNDKEVPTTEL